jgi:hypothetical protein
LSTQIRIVERSVKEEGWDSDECRIACNDGEFLLTAYCGTERKPPIYDRDGSVSCRKRAERSELIVAACLRNASVEQEPKPSFLGTLGFAQDASPPHQSFGPEHNWHNYQPTQDELEKLDLQDVTRKEAKEINRLYNQLESTGGEPQGGDELNKGGLGEEIEEQNRRLDKIEDICRGC